jgi:sulfate/thiosulfate transport system permease protein
VHVEAGMRRRLITSRKGILPGFGLTRGFTVTYLSLIVLIPLALLLVKATKLSWGEFVGLVAAPRALASYRLSFSTAFYAAAINAVFGLLVAWVLVRYKFPGKRIIDGMVDLPFALPTAVAGIALTAVYAKTGWLGKPLYKLGIESAYSPLGITIALTFIGLPFVVRTVQPILQNLEAETEEAAASLGASRLQTFLRVILPTVVPATLTGFSLALARGLGEYGSVVFIAGNMPGKTEITPLLIMTRIEEFDYAGAAAVAIVMLAASFLLLFLTNVIQWWGKRRGIWV